MLYPDFPNLKVQKFANNNNHIYFMESNQSSNSSLINETDMVIPFHHYATRSRTSVDLFPEDNQNIPDFNHSQDHYHHTKENREYLIFLFLIKQ